MNDATETRSDLPWVQAASGRAVDLFMPRPEQIDPDDIATALARQPRFNGHLRPEVTWSVAAHSVLVYEIVRGQGFDRTVALYALLHDAHEAYLGDVVTPVKRALAYLGAGRQWELLVQGMDLAIHARFGLGWPAPPDISDLVAAADRAALSWERKEMLTRSHRPWSSEDCGMAFAEAERPHFVSMMLSHWRHLAGWQDHAAEFRRVLSGLTKPEASANG